MANTLTQSLPTASTSAGTTSLGCTYGSALTSGTLLIALATHGNNSTPTVSDPTNGTWTLAVRAALAGVGGASVHYFLGNTSTSAETVTLAMGTSCDCTLQILEISGAAASSVLGNTAEDTGDFSNPVSTSITPAASNSMLVACIAGYSGFHSVDSGFTEATPDYNPSYYHYAEYLLDAGAPSAHTINMGQSGNQYGGVCVAEFKTAAGGNTGTGALTLGNISVAATGAMQPAGVGALTLAAPVIAAAGTEVISAAAALSLSRAVIAASGDHSEGIDSSAALALSGVIVAASGGEIIPGAGTVTLSNAIIAASGAVGNARTGTASLRLANAILSASGVETVSGSAALSLARAVIAGNGQHPFQGVAAIQLAVIEISAGGTTGDVTGSEIASLIQMIRRRRTYH